MIKDGDGEPIKNLKPDQLPKSNRTISVFNLKKSWEFIEFYKWCEINNRLPMKLIKKYCRYTVLQDRELE